MAMAHLLSLVDGVGHNILGRAGQVVEQLVSGCFGGGTKN